MKFRYSANSAHNIGKVNAIFGREFNIDDIMAQADTPIFYCYYKTTAGDVLGKL